VIFQIQNNLLLNESHKPKIYTNNVCFSGTGTIGNSALKNNITNSIKVVSTG